MKEVVEVAREHSAAAIATLAAICKSKTAPDAARVAAANSILDRAWGKPTQRNEGIGADGRPVDAVPLVMFKIER